MAMDTIAKFGVDYEGVQQENKPNKGDNLSQKPGSLLSGYALHVYNLQNQSIASNGLSIGGIQKRAPRIERSLSTLNQIDNTTSASLVFESVVSLSTFGPAKAEGAKKTSKTSEAMGGTTLTSPLLFSVDVFSANMKKLVEASMSLNHKKRSLNSDHRAPLESDPKRTRLKH